MASTYVRSGVHILLSSLGLLAALLWRDLFNTGIDLTQAALNRNIAVTRYPWVVGGVARVVLVVVVTVAVVLVGARLATYDTGDVPGSSHKHSGEPPS